MGALAVAIALASSAQAKVVNLRVYSGSYPAGSFFGAGSVGPGGTSLAGGVSQMDINQANGNFVVGSNNYWFQFNSSGAPLAFSAISPTTEVGPIGMSTWSDVAVDNSGGSGGVGEGEQGRIYAESEGEGLVKAWKPNGESAPGAFGGSGLSFSGVCAIAVDSEGDVWLGKWQSPAGEVVEFNPDGTPTGTTFNLGGKQICGMAIDAAGNFYVDDYGGSGLWKFSSTGANLGVIDPSSNEAADMAVDNSDGHLYTVHQGEAGGLNIKEYDASGGLVSSFGAAEGSYPGASPSGIAVNETTHTVYVATENRVDAFVRTGNITIPDVTTDTPSVTPSTATLRGHVDPDTADGGTPINLCDFEWGTDPNNLNQDATCEQGLPINGGTDVTATITGLTTGTTYFYKLTAANEGNGVISSGITKQFEPAGPPEIEGEAVSDINTDGARISATITPGGNNAHYRIEFGKTEAYGSNFPEPDGETADNIEPEEISAGLSGLAPGTTYHFRVVASNLSGTTEGPDHAFTTFAIPAQETDNCPNAQVRQQTGASLLLDCRAFELASAVNTNGYDVQSDLIPGEVTLPPEPGASGRLLYSVHFGSIPGTGEPTNLGLDPYLAVRGSNGWTTRYVGIESGSPPPNPKPFGSPLAASAANLEAFAFGGEQICHPCFADGSTGIPVRISNGGVVQGMKGSIAEPGAEPTGFIAKPLSANADHLVFGSKTPLLPDGHSGEIAIYDRNLLAGVTHIVSKTTTGETMKEEGKEIGELDVSSDGSRILFGHLVSTDAAGNRYWHLYMNVGDSPRSIDLTPGTTSGVLFDGMTADGTKVFFTTRDNLAGGDTDGSADLYRADVSSSSSSLTEVANTNGTGCDPVPGKEGPDWNVVSGGPDCSVVGLAGGEGVAAGDGTVFFLSPEKLGGSGTADQPNLFVVRGNGAPKFVATLEPLNQMVTDAVLNNEAHSYADFQVSTNGNHAVFASSLPLTGFNTFGHSEVFTADVASEALHCASCPATGEAPTRDTGLANGLNVTDEGAVFFTSAEALVLRDTNKKKDVYEWENGKQQLVSTGISDFEAGLLSATSDGNDVFFYTRATLVPQDENGNLMKIYDARRNGGFLAVASPPLCAASDECHGAGTQAAPPPAIGSFEGRGGNVSGKKPKCKKGFVRKHGKCVKKKHKKHKKQKNHKSPTARAHG